MGKQDVCDGETRDGAAATSIGPNIIRNLSYH